MLKILTISFLFFLFGCSPSIVYSVYRFEKTNQELVLFKDSRYIFLNVNYEKLEGGGHPFDYSFGNYRIKNNELVLNSFFQKDSALLEVSERIEGFNDGNTTIVFHSIGSPINGVSKYLFVDGKKENTYTSGSIDLNSKKIHAISYEDTLIGLKNLKYNIKDTNVNFIDVLLNIPSNQTIKFSYNNYVYFSNFQIILRDSLAVLKQPFTGQFLNSSVNSMKKSNKKLRNLKKYTKENYGENVYELMFRSNYTKKWRKSTMVE